MSYTFFKHDREYYPQEIIVDNGMFQTMYSKLFVILALLGILSSLMGCQAKNDTPDKSEKLPSEVRYETLVDEYNKDVVDAVDIEAQRDLALEQLNALKKESKDQQAITDARVKYESLQFEAARKRAIANEIARLRDDTLKQSSSDRKAFDARKYDLDRQADERAAALARTKTLGMVVTLLTYIGAGMTVLSIFGFIAVLALQLPIARAALAVAGIGGIAIVSFAQFLGAAQPYMAAVFASIVGVVVVALIIRENMLKHKEVVVQRDENNTLQSALDHATMYAEHVTEIAKDAAPDAVRTIQSMAKTNMKQAGVHAHLKKSFVKAREAKD